VQRRSANGVTRQCELHAVEVHGPSDAGGGTPNVGTGYVNPDDIDYDYGVCDVDRRHLFNLTAGVQSPDFKNAAIKAVASNWRLSGILRLFSGRPLNVTLTSDPGADRQSPISARTSPATGMATSRTTTT
jgi:hypothetical protein